MSLDRKIDVLYYCINLIVQKRIERKGETMNQLADVSEGAIMAFIIVAVLILLWVTMAVENRKNVKRFQQRVRRSWGQVPDLDYTAQKLESISHYAYRKDNDDFFIDDITWNDLDMDRIYMMMNQTVSSPGEDYLYAMLRYPRFSQEELDNREGLFAFFESHQKEREALQLTLAAIGRPKNNSISDAVYVLEDAPRVNYSMHLTMCLAAVASILVIPFQPVTGFFLFLFVSVINIGNYYTSKDKKTIEIYLDCFTSLRKMLAAGKKIARYPWEAISLQRENIVKACQQFKKFNKRGYLLAGGSQTGGGLETVILDYVRMMFHVDFLKYNRMLDEVLKHKKDLELLIDNIGELDSAIAVSSFRHLLPYYSLPDLRKAGGGEKISLDVQGLFHPLIEEPVANSIEVAGGTLVTGSNASGKSTFLKNIAVNSILAQTINTCVALAYRAPYLKVLTSMALRDDLRGGESYFIVEIKSLKRILEQADQGHPMLCIVDEVLRGTNTIERIAASSRILASLDRPEVLCFAATHDIELSYILEGIYTNYHFEEEVREKDVLFNYLLLPGRATTRNAIKLLDVMGYEPDLVRDAREAAEKFEIEGVWEKLKTDVRYRGEE